MYFNQTIEKSNWSATVTRLELRVLVTA